MNTLLLLSEIIISFASIIILYEKYNKEGIYIWLMIATIFGNIMITKSISISNLNINLGIIVIATIFVCSNFLIQKEGEKETNKILLLVFITSIISNIIFLLVSKTNISTINIISDKAFNNLFINNIILYITNTIVLLVTLKINNYIYYKVKLLENKIWIANMISMIITQTIYGVLIGSMYLAYINNYLDLIIIIVIRFLLAILTQVLGTILIYYLNTKKHKGGNVI